MSKWHDIFSTQTWEKLTGKLPVYFANRYGHVVETCTIQAQYPENLSKECLGLIDELGQLIREYHQIPKTQHDFFDIRKQLLKKIEFLSGQYIALRGDLLEHKKSKKLHDIHINMAPRLEHYKEVGLGSIDMWIVSLHKRCNKKSKYLDELADFIRLNPELERDGMISKILMTEHKDGKTYPGVLLEIWDPMHRQCEFDPRRIASDEYRDDKNLPMNIAFNQWLLSEVTTPFFLWLEEHPISTAHKIIDSNYQRVNSVNYDLSDAHIVTIEAKKKKSSSGDSDEEADTDAILMAKHEKKTSDWSLFDTKTLKSMFNEFCWKRGTPMHSVAYIWDSNDKSQFITHPHSEGKYHHASLSKGSNVRCAGMWVVDKGKITYLSNSSGHYRNSSLRFYQLVNFLYKNEALDDNADIVDLNDSQDNNKMSLNKYLSWAKKQPNIKEYYKNIKLKKQNQHRLFSVNDVSQETTKVKPEISASLMICQIQ